jgi:hypothetical protein
VTTSNKYVTEETSTHHAIVSKKYSHVLFWFEVSLLRCQLKIFSITLNLIHEKKKVAVVGCIAKALQSSQAQDESLFDRRNILF